MTKLATSSPREPDWVALRVSLGSFYRDRTSPAARDEAFGHVYQALRYLARRVVSRDLHPSQGSVTAVSEGMVDKVFLKKTFTDFALSYKPGKASFKTWATHVMSNKFVDWCREQMAHPDPGSIDTMDWSELKNEWESAIKDIADCDFDGARRRDVLGGLIAKEDQEEEHRRAAALRRALYSLPTGFKDVFLVNETKETQKQASRRLGISRETYKRRRKLVKALLKEALK